MASPHFAFANNLGHCRDKAAAELAKRGAACPRLGRTSALQIESRRFWLDLQNGNSGAEGGPATYNVINCQSLTSPVGSPDQPHGMTCNSHKGGYYCIDPHDITLTPSRR
jgi:hypothetical protein